MGVDAGEYRALIGVRQPGDVARGVIGVDCDGRQEGAGLAGDALAIEDVPVAVDDQDIIGAIAVDVGDHGRVITGVGNIAGVSKRPVAVAQQDRHVLASVHGDGEVGAAVAGEVTRHEGAWVARPHRVSDRVLERAVSIAQQDQHVVAG